jgi:hypothetical protein
MITFLTILFFLFFIAFFVFCGLFAYGVIKDKRVNYLFGTSREVWIGLIGLNVCNIVVQIINLIIKAIK